MHCDLKNFRVNYKLYNGYFSLCVCIFGSIANALIIIVLRTKPMWSPTNFILAALAIADLLQMLEYIAFTYHRNISSSRDNIINFTYPWAVFFKFHAYFTQVLHITSCYLNVILALWRYIYISRSQKTMLCASFKWTIIVIFFTYIISALIALPTILYTEIVGQNQLADSRGDMVLKEHISEALSLNQTLHNETIYVIGTLHVTLLSWIYGVIMKLFPCVLLSVLSVLIISVLYATKRRRRLLMDSRITAAKQLNGTGTAKCNYVYKENQAERTTRMLLVVLLLFLLTELSQGIFGIIIAIEGQGVLQECYAPIGDVLDLVTLINCSINFNLYCVMSRQFRQAFKEVFNLKQICSSRKPQIDNAAETGGETGLSLI